MIALLIDSFVQFHVFARHGNGPKIPEKDKTPL